MRGANLVLPPLVNPWRISQLVRSARRYLHFLGNARRYEQISGGKTRVLRVSPSLGEAVQSVGLTDPHYFYQDTWALRKIAAKRPGLHVDIGSRLDGFAAHVTALTRVVFVDIRIPRCELPDFVPVSGDLTRLPFRANAIGSLSCLHVIEHVGLGRYGDPLFPEGSQYAAAELARVLAPGGDLYIGTPIGREAVYFDAHRVFDPATVLRLFETLQLVEFCGVDDAGDFHPSAALEEFAGYAYGCGLFHFRKPLEDLGGTAAAD